MVRLQDAKQNLVAGKTITLSTIAASHATITPPSGVSSPADGSVTFTLKDASVEDVTFTATDETDGVKLTQTAAINFTGPPATNAILEAFPASVAADGNSNAVIAVTLKDSLGRPAPGKLINISQNGGNSVIKGPIPSLTDASGQVQFNAFDQVAENVTYSAVDVTDGNLPFPKRDGIVYWGPANGCGNSAPPVQPGFLVTPYAIGFHCSELLFWRCQFGGCPGAYGMAFDAAGNLYVSDFPDGTISISSSPAAESPDNTTL